jgi:aldehyde:ferredoxin oxidoreductase
MESVATVSLKDFDFTLHSVISNCHACRVACQAMTELAIHLSHQHTLINDSMAARTHQYIIWPSS